MDRRLKLHTPGEARSWQLERGKGRGMSESGQIHKEVQRILADRARLFGKRQRSRVKHAPPCTAPGQRAVDLTPVIVRLLPVADCCETARNARALHWPLEFPDVMQRGGFDVVLGNPPWEVMQLSEEEYFSNRVPEISKLVGAKRKKAIASLELEDPQSHREFVLAKRYFDAVNEFARSSGRFARTAKGKINTYNFSSKESFIRMDLGKV